MNTERLTKIAEWLEEGAIHVAEDGYKYAFSMDYWMTYLGEDEIETYAEDENLSWMPGECGGAMCIGGAAQQFFGTEGDMKEFIEGSEFNEGDYRVHYTRSRDPDEPYAAHLLGLTYNQARSLFHPWLEFKTETKDLSPQNAAHVVRHLMKTGVVDWSIIPGISRLLKDAA